MNATLMKELSKLSVEERRVFIDDLWDSIESELDALARDPGQRKFTLEEIAARNNIKL